MILLYFSFERYIFSYILPLSQIVLLLLWIYRRYFLFGLYIQSRHNLHCIEPLNFIVLMVIFFYKALLVPLKYITEIRGISIIPILLCTKAVSMGVKYIYKLPSYSPKKNLLFVLFSISFILFS